MLADDGTVILKFFLHISKKEQKKRFELIQADPLEAWRVTEADWARHKKYGRVPVRPTEEMLELTESEYAPWTIVEATSKWRTRRKCSRPSSLRWRNGWAPRRPARAHVHG